MMIVRLKHTLGFIFLIAVYAPIRMCELEEKEKSLLLLLTSSPI